MRHSVATRYEKWPILVNAYHTHRTTEKLKNKKAITEKLRDAP